jgi:hypothetical protein
MWKFFQNENNPYILKDIQQMEYAFYLRWKSKGKNLLAARWQEKYIATSYEWFYRYGD